MKRIALCLLCGLGLASAPLWAKTEAPKYRIVSRTMLGTPPGLVTAESLALDNKAGRLYIGGSQSIVVVNVRTHKVLGSIPQVERVGGFALRPRDGIGYATLWETNQAVIFNLKSLKNARSINVQTEFRKGWWPRAVVFEPKTARLFTFNESSGDCTAVDSRTNEVLRHIPLGGTPGSAVANGKGLVYANVTQTSEVVAIDAESMSIVKRWPLGQGANPTAIAIDSRRQRVFSVCANRKLAVSDVKAGKVVAELSSGTGDSVAYDPGAETVLVSNGDAGTLTAIRTNGPSGFSSPVTSPTLYGAGLMALDEKTHHVFLLAFTAPDTPGPYSGPGVPVLLEMAPG